MSDLPPPGGRVDSEAQVSPGAEVSPGYGESAARSAAWSAGTAFAVRLLRTASFFAMARLVSAEAFGLLALVVAVVSVAQIAAGLGLHQFITRVETLSKKSTDSAFWVSVAMGALLSLAVAGMAPVVGALAGEPDVTPVMLALSVLPLLGALSTVPTGILWRELRYRSLAVRNLVAALLSTAVAIVLAVGGHGVWALVAQIVVEAGVGTVMLWVAAQRYYRPRLSFSLAAAVEAVRFGWKIVGGDLLSVASYKADDLIVGVKMGATALGTYSVAYRMLTVLRETLQSTSGTVALAFFSRLQGDAPRLRSGFLRASRANAAIAFPTFLFVAAAAPAIVDVALGSQWEECAPLVTALATVGVGAAATDLSLALLVALGYPQDTLRFAIWNTALNIAAFLVAVQFGLVWVAVAFSVRAYVMLPMVFRMLRRRSGIGFRDVASLYIRILVSCLGVVGVGLWSRPLSDDIGSLPALLVTLALAAIVYVASLRILARDSYGELVLVFRALIRRGQSVAASPGAAG